MGTKMRQTCQYSYNSNNDISHMDRFLSIVDKLGHYVRAVNPKTTTESFKILQLEFANYDLMLAKVHF